MIADLPTPILKIANSLKNLLTLVNVAEKYEVVDGNRISRVIQICLSPKSSKTLKNLSKNGRLEQSNFLSPNASSILVKLNFITLDGKFVTIVEAFKI